MATASTSPPRFINFGDVRAYLGGIPEARIRLRPVPGEATEEDVLAVKAREGRSCELIDGILVELVWYVDPQARTVRVYTSARKSRLLTEDDLLDGGKVLPGLSLSIKTWFARASAS